MDWREDLEEEINCVYYNQEKDVCDFPCKGIFGEGCLGGQCIFYRKGESK